MWHRQYFPLTEQAETISRLYLETPKTLKIRSGVRAAEKEH